MHRPDRLLRIGLLAAALAAISSLAFAQCENQIEDARSASVEIEDAAPDCNCFRCRENLTGDWAGLRSELAESGLEVDLFATQFYQGVAAGGLSRQFAYGGKFDCFTAADGAKLGLGEGLTVNLHAETRFGQSVNNLDAMLTPSSVAMSFPNSDDSITSITGLTFTAELNENVALVAGKINTLDGVAVRYNGGYTHRGFMNTSLVFNTIASRTIPYAAAGAGLILLSDDKPYFSLTLYDSQERATQGLDNLFAHGVVIMPDFSFQTTFFDRPEVLNLGGTYSNAKYTSVNRSAYLVLPDFGAGFPVETGSWSLYANAYQSISAEDDDIAKSWGLFGQFGISDGNPNLVQFVSNAGLGGRSWLPGRSLDTFGIGFFYVGLSNNFKTLTAATIPQQDECGVECFYNYALTPWCRLTGDLQVANPSTTAAGIVIIPGLRLQSIF